MSDLPSQRDVSPIAPAPSAPTLAPPAATKSEASSTARSLDLWLMLARTSMHALVLSLEATAALEASPQARGDATFRTIAAKVDERLVAVESLLSRVPRALPEEHRYSIQATFDALAEAHDALQCATGLERAASVTRLMRAVVGAAEVVHTWRRTARA
jgi:hypothetical protein